MIKKNLFTRSYTLSITDKFFYMNWSYLLFICIVATLGILMLFSAGSTECLQPTCEKEIIFGSWTPWAFPQLIRFLFSLTVLFVAAVIDIRFWLKYAYFLYIFSIALLVAVELFGTTKMGAERWLDLKFFMFQPSELVKVALVMAMAKYFHKLNLNEVKSIIHHIIPAVMIIVPFVLVLRQPDLGTALIILMIGAVMFFVAGVQLWKFGLIIVSGLIAFPIIWSYVIQDYQKQRILTFLNPESDPLGAGYHITQSKIALGSGGFWGKGLFEGTQSHLNFLPEKQTDFLFAMLGEELGLVGSIILLLLYLTIIVYGYIIAYKSRNNFGKFIAVGLTTNFFLYLAINIAMVTGMMPVVGVPLPLISYGGTVMITLMFSFGLIQNAFIHGDMILSTTGD